MPERDLTGKVNIYLEDTPQPEVTLYPHVKKVYAGLEHRNIVLLHGPPATGKTFASDKAKKMLFNDYALSHISLSLVGFSPIVPEMERYYNLLQDVEKAILADKKVYIDIAEIEKFSNTDQRAIRDILEEYKSDIKIVFVFQSSYIKSGESINSEEREKLQILREELQILKGLGEDRMLCLEFKTKYR